MRFSLGFTADAAAGETKDTEAAPSIPTKMRASPAARHSTPPILTSRPVLTTVDASSSEEEEEDEEVEKGEKGRALPRQRSSRPKTVFQFAHPVATRRRLKLRLKLLLQLHEINRSSRPFPKYDILPADVPTRLICKLPKPYGNTRAFGARDMVVVTSDMYEQQNTSDDRSVSSEESCLEQREVVATICQIGTDDSPRKSRFEIAFSSGLAWEGIALPNGSYELVSKGGNSPPKKVRWVARDKKPVRQGTGLSAITIASPGRFTFSVINPNTRQHPVIASMTRKGLTVFDHYSYPAACSSPEQSPPGSPSTGSAKSSADSRPVHVDEELRKVIVMTGIWVAFMEGWSSKSPLAGDSSNRTESPLSPRSRSSTFLSADGEVNGESVVSLSGRPSRWNSKKVMNRRSTQSDFGREIMTEQQGKRRSKSLTAADRSGLYAGPDRAAESSRHVDHATLDAGHEIYGEGDSKKPKGWRRFSTILRRKKH